nr:izumo sperm-egg fusion protein 1 isoform X2 [Phascolarctos cinereus]XP_020859103.1 izumo sperm-egg fusion protein 1 isoform X2 [Phascolarctos cinereus]
MGSLLRSALPLGFVVLALALSQRRAWGCLLCDPAVVAGLRDLEQNYLPSHMDLDPQALQTLVNRLEETMQQFSDLPVEENAYQGVIDEPTLSKASWAFLKELRRIRDSSLRDDFLLKELTWTLHMQKEQFIRLAVKFQRESLCPNKCGFMLQTLIWCHGCEKQVHSCQKSYDCGAQSVRVTENDDLVLDCELSWHKAAEGLTDYRFYRVLPGPMSCLALGVNSRSLGLPTPLWIPAGLWSCPDPCMLIPRGWGQVWPNGSEILVSQSQESTLTKPMVSLEDSGVYRCILGTIREHSPATVITYHVKVDQEEEQSIVTWTSFPFEAEAGLEAELGPQFELDPCTDHGEVFADSGQNAARILNITLIWLVAGAAAAVLGSLALT